MPSGPTATSGDRLVQRRVRSLNLELAVTELGDPSRPTVLLVHGFPDSSASWAAVAQALSPEFHVVAYDVRGAGSSDVPNAASDYALPILVADMAAVIAAVSPDVPVHLVGHDWGSIQGWEAVTSELLTGRIASYTSISGPPIDHAALWAERHRTWKTSDLRVALRQATHSWYIGLFLLPYLPELAACGVRTQRRVSHVWCRIRGMPPEHASPSSTTGDDFAHGLHLYRANVRQRLRHPTPGHTTTPVQIIVPVKDRYITPALLDGLECWSPLVWRREVAAGHWIIRTHPNEIARWVRDVITFVEGGPETADLARLRVAPSRVG